MTSSPSQPVTHETSPMAVVELLVLTVMNGLILGTAYASFDHLYHAPDLLPADILVAVALAIGPAIAATLVVVAAVFVVFAVRQARPSRAGWTAMLADGDVVALCAAVVLIGTTSYRDWVGLCLIGVSVPLAVAVYAYAQAAPFYGMLDVVYRTLGFRAPTARFRSDLRVLRTETKKYIWSSDGRHQLFDLTHDPLETENQIERMGDMAKALDAQLATWWKAQPAYVREERDAPTADPLDEKTLERLRSLGYVGD